MDKRNDSILLALALVTLPFAVQIFAMAGFAIGLPVGHWQFPLAFAVAGSVCCISKKNPCKLLLFYFASALFSVFVSSLEVMFSMSDGDAYQRAGEILLANGWNPLRVTEPEAITALDVGTFRCWHVSFLPRMAWIYGASLYKCVGFCEAMDSLNALMPIASGIVVYRRIGEWFNFSRLMTFVWTLLIVLSPYTFSSMIGGANDCALYALIIVGVFSLERYIFGERSIYDILLMTIAFVLIAGLKYTGCVFAALSFAFGMLLLLLKREKGKALRVAMYGMVTGVLIMLANASPYITSTINHTSPFYPAHTFEREGVGEDRFTGDFDMKNEDAKMMGWFGRMAYAYVSKAATSAYYKWRTGKEDFLPVVKVFDGIEGYGGYFRLLLVCSLIGLIWVRPKGVRFIVLLFVISLLMQPAKYVGYVRYVSQIYMIPALVAMSLTTLRGRKIDHIIAIAVIGLLSITLIAPSFKVWPYAWLASVQNLQILEAAKKDSSPVVEAGSLAARACWIRDSGLNPIIIDTQPQTNKELLKPYGACARRSTYWSKVDISEFYDFGFADVAYGAVKSDAEFSSSRRAGAGRFFIRSFLPNEMCRLPRRISQWARLRCGQFARAWNLSFTK